MDYKDYQAGAVQEHFWFQGKAGLIDVLFSKLQAQQLSILNLGAGTGDDLVAMKKFGSLYALDIDQNALDLIPVELVVEKRLGDATALPYQDGFFDVVVAFDLIEHIEDDQKVVDEMWRVLKPGGSVIFTVPAFNSLFSGHDRVLHHFRRYNKKTIGSLFTKFQKKTLGYWFFFLFPPAALVRLINRDAVPSTGHALPSLVASIFYHLLRFENWLIRVGFKFPFGLTVYGIYTKK